MLIPFSKVGPFMQYTRMKFDSSIGGGDGISRKITFRCGGQGPNAVGYIVVKGLDKGAFGGAITFETSAAAWVLGSVLVSYKV